MYLLGPILIVLASVIIIGLSYLFFCIVLPMLTGTNWIVTMDDYHAYQNGGGSISQLSSAVADELQSNNSIQQNDEKNAIAVATLQFIFIAITTPLGIMHTTIVSFFLINIIYNYYKCVTTPNSGQVYDAVVRELATATNFNYPESEEELLHCKRELERKIAAKLESRQRELLAAAKSANNNDASNNNSTQKLPKIHNWQLLSPTEWSYCRYSKQPKPPRSHYDHVTKSLVLNMDHYCPWMFNCVGYFNYRYFCNFLWFTVLGLLYGAVICCKPFLYMSGAEYREQVKASSHSSSSGEAVTRAMLRGVSGTTVRHLKSNSYIPTPNERTPIALGFMVCLCLGCAVGCLLAFHVYLTLTAQTTIDFHGNWAKRKKKKGWTNPYSAGSWKMNWEMVYGTRYRYRSGNNDCVDGENEDDDRIYHRNDRYGYRGCWGMFMAMMPSNREPEFLPFPIDGVLIRRTSRVNSSSVPVDDKDEEVPEELDNDEDDVTAVFKRKKSPSQIATENMIPSNSSNGLTARVGRNLQRGEADMIV